MPRKQSTSDQPEQSDSPTAESAAPKPESKFDAMDATLAAGVADAPEAVVYIQEHFGMEISAKQFNTHKGLIKQKAAIDARLTKPREPATPRLVTPPAALSAPSAPAPTPSATAAPAPTAVAAPPAFAARPGPVTKPTRGTPPEVADAIQAIKGLVDALGVEQVKRIASLFGP